MNLNEKINLGVKKFLNEEGTLSEVIGMVMDV